MDEFIREIVNQWGYFGVFILIAVENIFPPIPSEVILLLGGSLTVLTGSNLTVIGMIISATLASLAGAILLYYIGKILKVERLKKIVAGKVGKVLRLKPMDIERADNWFDSKGNISVLFCRCVPLLRSLISIPAGMSEMSMIKFIIYTVVGSTVWNTILVVLGHNLGANWDTIICFFDNFSHIVVAILAVLGIGVLVWWFGFYRKKKIKPSGAEITIEGQIDQNGEVKQSKAEKTKFNKTGKLK